MNIKLKYFKLKRYLTLLTLIFFIVFKHARLVMPFIGLFQILCLRFPDKILYMFLLSYKSRGLKSFINCDSLHWDMAKITDFQNYFICFAFAFFVCFFEISGKWKLRMYCILTFFNFFMLIGSHLSFNTWDLYTVQENVLVGDVSLRQLAIIILCAVNFFEYYI